MELADMDRARAKLNFDVTPVIRETGDVVEHCIMDWTRRIFRVTYFQEGAEFTCYTRLYEKDLLKKYLLDIGFTKVDLFGSLALEEKSCGDNLIVVAIK